MMLTYRLTTLGLASLLWSLSGQGREIDYLICSHSMSAVHVLRLLLCNKLSVEVDGEAFDTLSFLVVKLQEIFQEKV